MAHNHQGTTVIPKGNGRTSNKSNAVHLGKMLDRLFQGIKGVGHVDEQVKGAACWPQDR
jgi:hypothetical protein